MYQVTIYTASKVYDQFKTSSKETAEKQGANVAKWAKYYNPYDMVLVTVKKV